MRRMLAVVALAALGVAWPADLNACGDKSMSAGGIRNQRAVAARYPASILMYAQANSRGATAARELKLSETLPIVGHKYREVASLSDAEAAVDSGLYNVVMAEAAELPALQQRIGTSRSKPVVIPIAYKLTKTQTRDVERQNRFVVKAPSRAAEYLTTIADAVRSKDNAPR